MSPGVGFVGGRLSVVGGYSWPGGVDTVEVWDDDSSEWIKNDAIKLRYIEYSLRFLKDFFREFNYI